MDFSALLQDELATYERNEWSGELGGKSVTLYAKPVTVDDVTHVSKRHPNFGQGFPSHAGMVDMIIRKAETQDGQKAFQAGAHRNSLLRLKAGFVVDLYLGLFAGEMEAGPDDEELEKN